MTTYHEDGGMGGLETPSEIAQIGTSQVVNYSDFLNELARQRHTIVKSYTASHVLNNGADKVEQRHNKLLDDLDTLIRDVLNHIQGNDLATTDGEPK